MAHSPIVARDVMTIEVDGIISAELQFSPWTVIFRLVSLRYLWPFRAGRHRPHN